MNKKIEALIGWYGFFAVLIGYFFLTIDVFQRTDFLYLFLNITGPIGVGIISLRKKAYSITAFYFIWVLIGIISLIKIAF